MGLFNTTIQTLSEMAIQESGVELPQVAAPAIVDEFKASLDEMPSLTEAEMLIPASAVPIKHNSRLDKYLIEMEDLSRFMITNKLTSIMESIEKIGDANGVSLSNRNTALVIDEASILQEMDDLGMNKNGSNSSDGNIGGIVSKFGGPHADIGKWRRFTNSKEVLELITNVYGLPVVKKDYSSIQQPPVKVTVNEDASLEPNPGDQVLNEKPAKEEDNQPSDPSVGSLKDVGPKNTEQAHQESMQLLRDIASGKFDDELLTGKL
jgi:hypothetical protein